MGFFVTTHTSVCYSWASNLIFLTFNILSGKTEAMEVSCPGCYCEL